MIALEPRSRAFLSQHLSLWEFTRTRHAPFIEEQANPPELVLANGQRLAAIIFEPIHALCGRFYVSSGWRCPGLNRAVRGRPDSAHLRGDALDIEPLDADMFTAFQRIAASDVPFDELLWEFGAWIHIQCSQRGREPRRLVKMTFDGKEYPNFDATDPRVLRIN